MTGAMDSPVRDPMVSLLAAWSRPQSLGVDLAAAGAGTPLPERTAEQIGELRVVAEEVRTQLRDVAEILRDIIGTGSAGVLQMAMVAADSLRTAADALETVTRGESRDRPSDAGAT